MAVMQIPLTDAYDQVQSIELSGVLFNLRVRLNYRLQIWTLDILDSASEPLVYGIPLVPGVDVLTPYNLDIEGLYAFNLNDTSDYLSVDALSEHGGLYLNG